MIKREERGNPDSCWNKGDDEEQMFILLGRDPATPVAIRAWVAERIRTGKNKPADPKIVSALDAAYEIQLEHDIEALTSGTPSAPESAPESDASPAAP